MAIKTANGDGSLENTLASKLDSTTAASTYLPIAGGKILQVVRATDSTRRDFTSSSLVDIPGMSVSITPQKLDSALIIIAVYQTSIGSDNQQAVIAITDSSNNILSGGRSQIYSFDGGSVYWPIVTVGYTTPSTTSSLTYKMRASTTVTTATIRNHENPGQMYAIEVSA